MPVLIGPAETVASLVLVAIAVGASVALGLGLGRELVVACARAAVQLVIVGFLFEAIVESRHAWVLCGIWVVAMVVIAAVVISRRAPAVPGLWMAAAGAVAASTTVVLGVVFGLGTLEATPSALIVIAGIGIGNTLPSAVLGARLAVEQVSNRRAEIEALLALGFDRRSVARFITAGAVRSALTPQIERTRVVGLIALPGAMTGLLLAGVDPLEAIMVQLVVMYLVLGSVAIGSIVVASTVAYRSISPQLGLEDWTVGLTPQ